MATKVFGIDLGTTYSCIAHVDRFGRPEVLGNLDGELTTPSVVLFDSDTDYVVGRQAKRQARISPDHVVSLVKRHMGDSSWRFTAHGKEWSAPAVSSLILRALTDAAARATGEPVTDVEGGLLRLAPESICVHGDTPGAVAIARQVREALTAAGVALAPFAA